MSTVEIRKILMEYWDPIGIRDTSQQDEYDDYIPMILWILGPGDRHFMVREQLFNHLWRVETLEMGLWPSRSGAETKAARIDTVVDKLLGLS